MTRVKTTSRWSTTTQLRFRDFDYLGHMTATSYLALIEEARVAWLAGTDPDGHPAYVVAQQTITFHREILPKDGPVTIEISGQVLSNSRFQVTETITGSGGTQHATSSALLVAWDRDRRRPRTFSSDELSLLRADEPEPTGVADDGRVHVDNHDLGES